MNALRNNVRLIGHLGEDPKVTQFENGKTVVNFSLATNEFYKDKDGKKQSETTWHRIVAWGQAAKTAEKFLTKGKEVALEGKLSNRSYEDKDGNKRYISEVVINSILMLGKN